MEDRRPKLVLEVTGSDPLEPCGYLRFDGAELYARSAASSDPLRVAGEVVGERWQRVTSPAFITAGAATIVFRSELDADGDADDRTVPSSSPPCSAPRLPSESDWDEVTPVDPLFPVRAPISASSPVTASTVPVALPSSLPEGRPEHRTLVDVPPAPPPAPRPPSRGEQLLARIVAKWKQTPLPRKAMVALLPVAFASVSVLFGGGAPAETAATASTGAPPHAGRLFDAAPPVVDAATSIASAVQLAGPPGSDAPPLASRPDGGKTDERLTVDAVVAGDYATAALRYERLARAHPEEPVFPEAARILLTKVDGGAR